MAKKKKAKKKKLKKAKRKGKAQRAPQKPRPRPKLTPYQLLLEKIDRIKQRVPSIEPTGECTDPDTGEVLFRFTEAQHVFNVYRTECDIEGLHYRPYADATIQPKAIAIGNMPLIIGIFCIEDIKTGAKLIGWGSGMGANRDWSGNTANTRALKQFLLTTFEANWEDPENPKQSRDQLRKQVIQELEADGTLATIEQMKYWAENLGKKGVPNDTGSKGKDTKVGRRADSKKARAGAKRDNRRSKKT